MIGYGYHPTTTATYMQRALERRAQTTFVGTPYAGRPGYWATGDLNEIIADLPAAPDLYLHVDSGATWYFPRGLTRTECATACYLIDVHVQPNLHCKKALFFDYAFTAQRDFVKVLRGAGHPNAHWLPLACDPQIHRRYEVPKRYDIGFVGAMGGLYERRGALLRRLARRFSVNDYSHSYTPSEMARVYSEARLVFNCSLRREVNMRAFEGPATGTLLLTDRIGNGLSELLRDGEHVAMYDDESVVDVAAEYLGDEARRERVAAQGYEHVRAHHTYDHRVSQVLETVFDSSREPERAAPLRRRSDIAVELAYLELFALVGRVDDTIQQFKRVAASRSHRPAAAKHLALCLARRVRYG